MSRIEHDLLSHNCAALIAPAGCGKTETIVNAISLGNCGPQLVLTHTNVGVAALEQRFKRKGVSHRTYKIQTISSFALEYSKAYPNTAKVSDLLETQDDYFSKIIEGANLVLSSAFGRKIIKATYSGVFVDEYQDCSLQQHALIKSISDIIPCRVLGDPLQGIFDFDEIVDWNKDVYTHFELIGELTEPWRWKKTNPQLGEWISSVRQKLINNDIVSLSLLPKKVFSYVGADFRDKIRLSYSAIDKCESTVILFRFARQAHSFARSLGGAYHSDEEVQCNDLLNFFADFECADSFEHAKLLFDLAEMCNTRVSTALKSASSKLSAGSKDFTKIRVFPDIIKSVETVMRINDNKSFLGFIYAIEKHKDEFKLIRKELWNEAKRIFIFCDAHQCNATKEIARKFRTEKLLCRNYQFKNMVSRVLLVKGLEFGQVLVMNADELSSKEFYVSISRPQSNLSIFASSSSLALKK